MNVCFGSRVRGSTPLVSPLADPAPRYHRPGIFTVTEADADLIRAAFERGGEFSAAVELRWLFPAISDNAEARRCARTIAGWKPLVVPMRPGGF